MVIRPVLGQLGQHRLLGHARGLTIERRQQRRHVIQHHSPLPRLALPGDGASKSGQGLALEDVAEIERALGPRRRPYRQRAQNAGQ